MEWHDAITQLQDHIVRISTPQGSGTGWLVSASSTTNLRAIATAAHVIDHAHYWDEPIRLFHHSSGKSLLLKPASRAINLDPTRDVASIIFEEDGFELPKIALPMIPKDKYTRPGVEIGWLGFPAVHQSALCFFSGRISAYVQSDEIYLVDGVAINGVSGGPAFRLGSDTPQIMGVVSAYIANRATGEVLPGVAVIRDASPFHDVAERFHTLDHAKAEETPPTEPPAPAAASDTPSTTTRNAS